MLVLAIELVFLLLFARALTSYLRGRDALAGDVTLVFGAVSGLFALTVLTVVINDPPRVLTQVATAMLLAQPVLTLRLVAHLRDLPRLLLPIALVVYVATAGPVLVLSSPDPRWATWVAVGGFALVELSAAAYLWGEARRRTGAPRPRLQVAAVSTALFAAALLAAGAGAGSSARIIALASGVGYVAAFMPPDRLRRMGAMAAAHDFGRDLLASPVDSTPEEVWRRFACAIDDICDVDAVLVLGRTPAGGSMVLAAEGVEHGVVGPLEHVDFDLLTELSRQRSINAACPIERTFAEPVGARFSTRVPLHGGPGGPVRRGRGGDPGTTGPACSHVALLLSRHRTLFNDDDLDVVVDLGAQAALLAGRATASEEQQRLSHQLTSTVEALKVASNTKSNLLARVSHEFRTPLTVIIGYCAILRRTQTADLPPLAVEAVDRIDDAGQHLLTLVEEVLDVAKMDAGHLDLRVEDVDVQRLVERTMEEMRPLAARKRLTLQSQLTAGSVQADPRRLMQVLYNLSSNAIKFTPEGGAVRFRSELGGGEVRISVEDTGIGIRDEDQTRVFDEFTQLEVEPTNRGTGLGLAIAQRLVLAHGGRTELESTPGEGSRFTVVLPSARSPEGSESAGSASHPGRSTMAN